MCVEGGRRGGTAKKQPKRTGTAISLPTDILLKIVHISSCFDTTPDYSEQDYCGTIIDGDTVLMLVVPASVETLLHTECNCRLLARGSIRLFVLSETFCHTECDFFRW